MIRFERFALVFDIKRLRRDDFARVPQIAMTIGQRRRAGSDEDLVGGLYRIGGIGIDHPTEMRRRMGDQRHFGM